MTRAHALRLIERRLNLYGPEPELREALQVLSGTVERKRKPAKRDPLAPFPPVKAVRGLGQMGGAALGWNGEQRFRNWQRNAYLDTFGERGSDERAAQERRLRDLPHLPQFDYDWLPVARAKLLTLQAVDSMARTAYAAPALKEESAVA